LEKWRSKALAGFPGDGATSRLKYFETMNQRPRQCGTTLIELSVVIAVLLLLVGVLFIGMSAWKSGANKAACIVNLAGIQKAVRGYQDFNGLATGDNLTMATMTSAGFWTIAPTCPAGGTYTATGTVPAQGVAYMSCNINGHAPSTATLANW
jgi:type II secretory pathway pseudopilin PulG